MKANALARIRQIFTQEIFTEEVITAHAVTVPVTEDLNAGMSGYLAIHCIYQLLKSRAFSKYKVPIKVIEYTLKILKVRTPEKFAVITLKFEQCGFTVEQCVQECRLIYKQCRP